MASGELACTYAALILSDDGIAITAEKIATIVKAANIKVESYWPALFAKLLEKRSVEDLILSVGSGGGGGGYGGGRGGYGGGGGYGGANRGGGYGNNDGNWRN
uniref:60S acidic ribosomal protein P1 n=1 Tax=Zea mays TaxID=4577 RepID=B6TBN5_MAIZE|nr:60S acidic ribosomal protein P1 [Zea mays]